MTTHNGVEALSGLTGLSSETIAQLAAQVKANVAKLNSCPRHAFDPSPGFMKPRTCRACGGTVSASSAGWYEDGQRHGADSA